MQYKTKHMRSMEKNDIVRNCQQKYAQFLPRKIALLLCQFFDLWHPHRPKDKKMEYNKV